MTGDVIERILVVGTGGYPSQDGFSSGGEGGGRCREFLDLGGDGNVECFTNDAVFISGDQSVALMELRTQGQ